MGDIRPMLGLRYVGSGGIAGRRTSARADPMLAKSTVFVAGHNGPSYVFLGQVDL